MTPPSSPSEPASGRGLSGMHRAFSDPLHRFQMLVNLPALFLSGLSSRPRALRLRSAPHGRPPREHLPRPSTLQLKASLLGTGLAVRLRPPRLSSCLPFLRLAALPPPRLPPCPDDRSTNAPRFVRHSGSSFFGLLRRRCWGG